MVVCIRKGKHQEVIRMQMTMPKISQCNAQECAYNKNNRCHALAITVGGPEPRCDTALQSSHKGGLADNGSVGACKVERCMYNKSLECSADEICVSTHSDHAECDTFKSQ